MKYLIILFLLFGCGIKPSATCGVDLKKDNVKEVRDSCMENPTIKLKKDF